MDCFLKKTKKKSSFLEGESQVSPDSCYKFDLLKFSPLVLFHLMNVTTMMKSAATPKPTRINFHHPGENKNLITFLSVAFFYVKSPAGSGCRYGCGKKKTVEVHTSGTGGEK